MSGSSIIDQMIAKGTGVEKPRDTSKMTLADIVDKPVIGNADLDEVKEQVNLAKSFATGKSVEETSADVQQEIFEELEQDIVDDNPMKCELGNENNLDVYQESPDGVDTESELKIKNSFQTGAGGFYLVTTEYERAKRSIEMIGNSIHGEGNTKILEWTALDEMEKVSEVEVEVDEDLKKNKLFHTLARLIKFVEDLKNKPSKEKYVFVIKDITYFVNGRFKGEIIQAITKLNNLLHKSGNQLVITDVYEKNIVEDLSKIIGNTIKFDLPTEVDLNRMIKEIYPELSDEQKNQLTKKNIKRIIDMLLGIEYKDARMKLLSIFNEHQYIGHSFFMELSAYKKDMINKHKALEYMEPREDFTWDNYIGRSRFKETIDQLKIQVEHKEQFGKMKKLNSILLSGQPGTGKSYAAECIAHYLGKPVVRVTLGRLLGKYQGDAEEAFAEMRKIFLAMKDQAVFWVDEFEKMFPTGDSNISKSSVESRMEGAMLTLFQDLKDCGTIMILTSNEPWRLSAPTLRAQRIDELFFFGFPNISERRQLFDFFLKRQNVELDKRVVEKLVVETENFSESEIESFVKKIVTKFITNKLVLSINKERFITKIGLLETSIKIVESLMKRKVDMKVFVKDLYDMKDKKLIKKYGLEQVSFIEEIILLYKHISHLLTDKVSMTLLANHNNIKLIKEWLDEDENIVKEEGNIADIIRGMYRELEIGEFETNIVDSILSGVFNNNKILIDLNQLGGINYLLDSSKNRESLLVMICHYIQDKKEISEKEEIYSLLKRVNESRTEYSLQEFIDKIREVLKDTCMLEQDEPYVEVCSSLDMYKSKVIFPVLTEKNFLDRVKSAKDGISFSKNKKDCEKIAKWGEQHAVSASLEQSDQKINSYNPNFFDNIK